ncbi:MAG TPA: hypothetical protein VHP58_03800 [Alphaproteobacteria bacterium]|nr:hypothetical protein [Alphaproteobacteria bacterium]
MRLPKANFAVFTSALQTELAATLLVEVNLKLSRGPRGARLVPAGIRHLQEHPANPAIHTADWSLPVSRSWLTKSGTLTRGGFKKVVEAFQAKAENLFKGIPWFDTKHPMLQNKLELLGTQQTERWATHRQLKPFSRKIKPKRATGPQGKSAAND